MKILLVSHVSNNPSAGASSVYHVLADGLRARGHQVNLLHMEDLDLPRSGVLRKIAVKTALPRIVSKRAERELEKGYDVIMSSNGMTAPLFDRIRQKTSRPLLVSHYHGLQAYDHLSILTEHELGHMSASFYYRALGSRFTRNWDLAGMRNADICIVQNSRDLSYVEAVASATTKVHNIAPALHPDLLKVAKSIDRSTGTRESHRIVYLASWQARKGSYYVPAAFRKIRQACPEAELLICGTGMNEAELKAHFAYQDRASVTGISYLQRSELPDLFARAGIFLFPSISEGFGLALLEAQAFDLAAVSCPTGYAADYLRDREDARIVPLASEYLANACIDLIRDPEKQRAIARNGRALASQFTVERMIAEYEAVLAR